MRVTLVHYGSWATRIECRLEHFFCTVRIANISELFGLCYEGVPLWGIMTYRNAGIRHGVHANRTSHVVMFTLAACLLVFAAAAQNASTEATAKLIQDGERELEDGRSTLTSRHCSPRETRSRPAYVRTAKAPSAATISLAHKPIWREKEISRRIRKQQNAGSIRPSQTFNAPSPSTTNRPMLTRYLAICTAKRLAG